MTAGAFWPSMCGQGSHDPCTKLLVVAVTTAFCFFLLNAICRQYWGAWTFEDEVFGWESVEWLQTECQVLAAGVSCINTRDTNREEEWGLCKDDDYANATLLSSQPPVFSVWQRAVCPGTFWCANEHEPCACQGEITFGPALFDGLRYSQYSTLKVASRFTVQSNGSWLCGADQQGQLFKGVGSLGGANRPKHCWCTPRRIAATVQAP
ncbi:unnamed protein product [Effrenium voratum]|nr:unnamed protein product [Effrenium voratum]